MLIAVELRLAGGHLTVRLRNFWDAGRHLA